MRVNDWTFVICLLDSVAVDCQSPIYQFTWKQPSNLIILQTPRCVNYTNGCVWHSSFKRLQLFSLCVCLSIKGSLDTIVSILQANILKTQWSNSTWLTQLLFQHLASILLNSIKKWISLKLTGVYCFEAEKGFV